MTNKSSRIRAFRHIAPRAGAALLLVGALVAAPLAASSAEADGWWGPVYENCGSKIVQITFHVTGGWVYIGYNQNEDGVGNYPIWSLYTGTHTINTGEHAIWWEKWNTPGTISSWSDTCVSYQ